MFGHFLALEQVDDEDSQQEEKHYHNDSYRAWLKWEGGLVHAENCGSEEQGSV
jgi:hypothetical protein